MAYKYGGFMELVNTFIISGLVILGYMLLLWLISLALKNSSIVDIFWGLGFVVTAWVYSALTPMGVEVRKWLLLGLVTIWGLRLSLHILIRNWGKAEDFRYQVWRKESGRSWWWKSFFKVFLLQGFLMWVISAPLYAAQAGTLPKSLVWLDVLGMLVWLYGFFFEALGDWQLARFKADSQNRGKVLDYGVWRYTRHPNYFGDSAQWWGYYLIALAAGGWWTFFSPLLMTLLLLRVSGVALLEKSLSKNKPQYKEYMEKTSAFIPMPPRKLSKKGD
jgi:steroid 5-alpha reductase family enzyme